jgi:Putative MetA-pathway of phenol degradation
LGKRDAALLIGILPLLLLPATAHAWELPTDSDHALPCRPTIACTADIVPAGTFEFEGGLLNRTLGGNSSQFSTPWLAKLSVEPWLQLQAAGNGDTVNHGTDSGPGQNDLTLGAKFHLTDAEGARPSLSFSAAASVPLATGPVDGQRVDETLLTAYVSQDFGRVHLDLNVGLNLWKLDADPTQQQWVALAGSTEVAPQWTVMAEGYTFTDAGLYAPRDGGLLMAVAYALHPWLVLDGGTDIGFFPATRGLSVFAGLTVIPAVLWRPGVVRPAPN